MWAEIRLYVIIIGIAFGVCIISSTAFYYKGKWDGGAECEAKHDSAQLKENIKENKADAKRDRSKPSNADRATKLEWLRTNARKQ